MKITINPDKEYVQKIRNLLKISNNYCPCKVKRTQENICMCKEFREQETSGWCHCKLYYKEIEPGD